MKIIIVGATKKEMQPLFNYLETSGFKSSDNGGFVRGNLQIYTLISGIGCTAMATSLTPLLYAVQPSMAICIGVAGAFPGKFKVGEVVNVQSEQFGDLGIEEADGQLKDLFEIGLVDPNQFPFTNGILENPSVRDASFLPLAQGLTVNRVHGTTIRIKKTLVHFEVDIESMEGAAFFYSCLIAQIPFLEIRAISNIVEPRNRAAWKIDEAILNLNEAIIDMIEVFSAGAMNPKG